MSFAFLDLPNLLLNQNLQSWAHLHLWAVNCWASYPIDKCSVLHIAKQKLKALLTLCNTKCLWQWSSPLSIINIQDLISAGINKILLSLITCSKSESRYSSTRFKLVLCEKTSISCELSLSVLISSALLLSCLYTSITLGWRSSWRYFTSLIAVRSSPSLNWPILIFLMATLRPVCTEVPRAKR